MRRLLLICSALFAVPAALLCQAVAPSMPPAQPIGACPIEVTQAWLDAAGATMPAATGQKDWNLHVRLTNKSEQAIVAFVVHADLAALPGRSLAKPETSEQVQRHWTGELAAMAPLTRRWKIRTGPNTMGLKRVWFDGFKFADGSSWRGDQGATCSFAATGHMVPAHDSH